MPTWSNDGLLRKYGTDRTTPQKGGEYVTTGLLRNIEFKINLATLTEAETILGDTIIMPKGMRISEIKVTTTTAGAPALTGIDLGLVRMDRTTEVDYDGLLAAFPVASMDTAGETTSVTKGGTGAGALIGTTTTNPAYFTCSRINPTAFTAGEIVVEVKYYRP